MSTTQTPPSDVRAQGALRSGEGYFHAHRGDLAQRLREAIPRDVLRDLHARSGLRHAIVALRQVALYGACAWALVAFDEPWIWLPVAALQGCVILTFIILLHDVVHECAFARRRPRASRLLALLYAAPSAIAATQFSRWHLDHHKELGSEDRDPKRAHLSPKRNSRLLKFLYMTPVLFVLYARAAGQEVPHYPAAMRRTIALERLGNVALHVVVAAALWAAFGGEAVLRAWFVPLFLFFPIAFTVNRLGQHYWVDASDPAKWGTRVDGGPLVNLLFLNSNLHLEHHYFPGVPLYRLPALNRALRPFWQSIDHPSHTYRELLFQWFVRNKAPHTDWS